MDSNSLNIRAGCEKPDYMQCPSVYILSDIVTCSEVDCTLYLQT